MSTPDERLLAAAKSLAALPADDPNGESAGALAAATALVAALGDGADPDAQDEQYLRAVDLLVRGRDNLASAQAIDALVGAGSQVLAKPTPDEAPPLHAAAFYGAWRALTILLDVGAPVDGVTTATRQGLAKATPLIALASGYRAVQAADYEECLNTLLEHGADCELRDRRGQSAVDIAMMKCAGTQDRSLVDAFLHLGVNTLGNGRSTSAHDLAEAIAARSKGTAAAELRALMLQSAIGELIHRHEAAPPKGRP